MALWRMMVLRFARRSLVSLKVVVWIASLKASGLFRRRSGGSRRRASADVCVVGVLAGFGFASHLTQNG
jgi:hypothetical protein